MSTRAFTLTDVERLQALEDADRTFQMTEDAFRIFYDRTARPLWAFLVRMTGDGRLADDLLQDTYYRFLISKTAFESDTHRRRYLFRIATNLVRDHRRRPSRETALTAAGEPRAGDEWPDAQVARRVDLRRAMAQLSHRERSLLWLAYGQGCSHEEIAGIVGIKAASLKVLLHRARRKLASLLRAGGPSAEETPS